MKITSLFATATLAFWVSTTWAQTTLFQENFDSVNLGQVIDEPVPDVPAPADDVWSKTPPVGWNVDDSQMPEGGVAEWRGWSFTSPFWWDEVAGQDRGNFTFGTDDVVAVADSDEWDDAAHAEGTFNSFLNSPPISLSGLAANSATMSFDSSWRADGTQIATVSASYDGAPAVELLRYESNQDSDFFMPDANPDFVELELNNPAGASEVVLSFGLTEAGNNWWWAVDNIEVNGAGQQLLFEDFESV